MNLIDKLARRPTTPWDDVIPISAELFGPERFEQHAHSLAASQKTAERGIGVYSVVLRLEDNAKMLLRVYREICATVAAGKVVTPAAEWLIDNYHLVEEQVRQTRDDLPEGFYRQLPKLAEGPLAGHPRIFGVVWAYVAHTDSLFEPQSFASFINAYQTVEPLTIGELWAAAISLRLILIENLRRISVRMNNARLQREAANTSADRILSLPDQQSDPWIGFEANREASVANPFAVQLLQRLRDLDDARAAQVLEWLQTKVAEQDHTLESVVNAEHHRQTAANVTVRNIVHSMRLVSDVNWESWFDSVSLIDRALRGISLYEEMDFQSRNMYRTAIEVLARGSGRSEMEIAQGVLARSAAGTAATDPGYWLIGTGRLQFEHDIGFKPAPLDLIRKFTIWAGLAGYLGLAFVLCLVFSTFAVSALWVYGVSPQTIVLLLLLGFLPLSEIAIAGVNYIVSWLLETRTSPGLALRDGVPERFRTLVAIPALLTSREGAEELLDRLEVHFLSSGPGELYFALVTDWLDSGVVLTPQDTALLDRAESGILELNRRHDTDRFFLIHRNRTWNEVQQKWMGWERKRGKLHELNRLLRGAVDTNFMAPSTALPANVRFVITLDADTRLPRDAARRLVGKIAHPLNTPVFDQAVGRVVSGHGIMQPRVTASLPTGHYGSYFQRLYSTVRGIDPYVFAASDLYQDLSDEGSFTGKGIYDVDAFESSMAGRIPDGTVLSHDLFEGNAARAGLVSDIEVVDEFPEQYEVSAARQHRWARGDWQLLPWILGIRNTGTITRLGRWKMIDNLRRSLVPITQLLAFFAGWSLMPPQLATLWTIGVLLTMLLPLLLPAMTDGLRVPRRASLQLHMMVVWGNVWQSLALTAANVVLLANQATLFADAILRTLYRLAISRRNLLEWTTAAQVQATAQRGLRRSYLQMLPGPAISSITLSVIVIRGVENWFWLAPFCVAWFAAPSVAYWMSQSTALEDELAASETDRSALRMTARRTWRYFEQFVTPEDNMLPPDNFQEDPKPVVAHRTSPTNIGLYLLSIVAGREYGWFGTTDTVTKMESVFATIAKLEKFRGHLYNWYDTQSLAPLEPKYVSSVDSGNLAGHLIAIANSCERWRVDPAESAISISGIDDVLDIIKVEVKSLALDRKALHPLRNAILQKIDVLKVTLDRARHEPDLFAIRLVELAVQANLVSTAVTQLASELSGSERSEIVYWSDVLRVTVESHFRDGSANVEQAKSLRKRLQELATLARDLAYSMEFGFLFDGQRLLLAIGYRVREGMRDESCYDMLASEARLASFFAIAKGDLKTRHWFRLGRTVTALKGGVALVSWSGSMFEYLMPSLVMRAPSGGMLDQTTRLVVARQIDYAKEFGVPWGISESAFSARDAGFTYQYSNFGVPGLGLKRGLADNLVISPYATGLAAMVAPRIATRNYEDLQRAGALGRYGFYEALDYTPARLSPGAEVAVIRAYFAHHQGMTIVAILNAVREGILRAQFHNEPSIRAVELLLQERAPRNVLPTIPGEAVHAANVVELSSSGPRVTHAFQGRSPVTHLLSNGQYSVMITAAGGGYSNWNGISITRWREDPVADDWGHFFYLREPRADAWWSAGHMPSGKGSDSYEASFFEHKAEIVRTDGNWTTTLECIVSSENNAEARRLTVENSGLTARDLEVTSFIELVLAPAAADTAHPAFSKMFVETQFIEGIHALVATRRKRSPGDPDVWVAQVMLVEGVPAGPVEYETDRARFIGRCNDVRAPDALASASKLSGTVGAVLDPIFALRQRVRVPRGRQVRITLWTMVAESKKAVLDLVDQHRQAAAFERALMMAWTQGQIQLRHLSIAADEAHLFQELASHILFSNPALRPTSALLQRDIGLQSTLWSQGISGDHPIVLLRIDTNEDIETVRQIVRAAEYWKSKRLIVDLVILNDRMSSYVQDLQLALDALVRKIKTPATPELGIHHGEIFVLRADLVTPETLRVLSASARIVLYARRGGLGIQLARLRKETAVPVNRQTREPLKSNAAPLPAKILGELSFFNGVAGFAADGSEYVIYPTPDKPTPAPWTNVIANPNFGFHCSGDGAGYTWIGNSKEIQLTGWSNDPVSNRPSEAVYVTDMHSGITIMPTLLPMCDQNGSYVVRHGFGYSVFERQAEGLKLELLQLVPLSDSVKISRLKIHNLGREPRKLRVTHYAEWVLGASRAATAPFIASEIDEATGALIARNAWTPQFENQVAFVDFCGEQTSWTADRLEFLGRYGSLDNPQSLAPEFSLSKSVGAGMDPCAALQTEITIAPDSSRDVTILLGAASDIQTAQKLVSKYRLSDAASVLQDVKQHWDDVLGAVKVKSPDPAFDVMMNGWLLYQTLACRMWARSGFYQASGAYGFRDQLQDSMALLLTQPDLARQHILRAAARQFHEGDVQHWWLPSTGTGIRTRFSDDVVWLAWCTTRYVTVTGDYAILDNMVQYLDGPQLQQDEHDAFFQPVPFGQVATLYEHCANGLEKSLIFGVHGLPLMGGGDWNDGMNRVGVGGRGESVWLGWFIVTALEGFLKIARRRKDTRADAWDAKRTELIASLERDGWDGAWYRRAFYDDGTPLGSSLNSECTIDAIAQSWSAISRTAKSERVASAMSVVDQQLILKQDKVALLFTPPFDKSEHDPGYIKAYPPGIRENGGQYTHGVIWSVFAFAELSDAEKAWSLFSILNPVNHGSTAEDIAVYRVEPYVVAADIYSVAPHVGRGGWTWYTGASGWLYRAGLEAILGINKEGNTLHVKPCMPPIWKEYEVSVKFGTTVYQIVVRRDAVTASKHPTTTKLSDDEFIISLHDDGGIQRVELQFNTTNVKRPVS